MPHSQEKAEVCRQRAKHRAQRRQAREVVHRRLSASINDLIEAGGEPWFTPEQHATYAEELRRLSKRIEPNASATTCGEHWTDRFNPEELDDLRATGYGFVADEALARRKQRDLA